MILCYPGEKEYKSKSNKYKINIDAESNYLCYDEAVYSDQKPITETTAEKGKKRNIQLHKVSHQVNSYVGQNYGFELG